MQQLEGHGLHAMTTRAKGVQDFSFFLSARNATYLTQVKCPSQQIQTLFMHLNGGQKGMKLSKQLLLSQRQRGGKLENSCNLSTYPLT